MVVLSAVLDETRGVASLEANRYVTRRRRRSHQGLFVALAFSVAVVSAAVQGCSRAGGPEVLPEAETSLQQTASPVGAATGQMAVQSFLSAVEAGSVERVAPVVSESQLALLVGVEDPTGDLMADLVYEGVPVGVARNFWVALADSFEPFAGADLTGWQIGSDRAVIVDGVTYVFVEVTHELGSTELVAVETANGWIVDLFASFGHAFAPVFIHWLEAGPAHDNIWGPVLSDQETSIEMSIDRTDADSIYQQDLETLSALVSRLQPVRQE